MPLSSRNGDGTVGGELTLQLGYTKYEKPITRRKASNNNNNKNNNQQAKRTKRTVKDSEKVVEAKKRGADIVDVTDFIDVEEGGKAF